MVLLTRHRAKRSTVWPKAHTQQLMNMPLDVLIEIVLFLEPLDLLHLARTTKALREFLLDRGKSSALWKNVISNVEGFPPCPDHMSPPAYTHLAFVPVCHGCFCPCETVEWELRMRCCPDCFPEMTTPRYCTCSSRLSSYQHELPLPIAKGRYKLNDGLDIITVFLECTLPPSFSIFDLEVVKSRKRPRNVSIKKFLAQENDFWESIQRHARACQHWEHRRLQEKAAQLMLVRKKRVEDIKGKLRELGWADIISSDDHNYDFLRLPQVRKLEPLTPTEWADIRPQLISWALNQCMNTFVSVSLGIQQELESDTSLKVQPRKIDIAMLPVVRSTLHSAIHSDMSKEDLKKKLLRTIPPAIRKWSLDAVEELEQFAREQLRLPPLSKSPLYWVVFQCKACSRYHPRHRLSFDGALSHHHLYKKKRKEEYKDGRKEIGEMIAYDKLIMCDTHPRNIQPLRVDVTRSRRVENLVRRMGQNPSSVTYDQLCRSTVKVICSLCRPGVAKRMDFEHAFRHSLGTHLWNKETDMWTRAPARE